MEIEDRIRASFARQGLMTTLGARLDSAREGKVEVSAPIRPETGQQQGMAHAGLTFAIGDSAAGYAALSVMPADNEVVTSEMKIHLLAPARGTRLVARGRVVKPGRRLVIVTADVFALDGAEERHVALLTGTMVPVPA
ncbi:PaaI family thioesterase [Salipiger mucosus]|uniref:Phenylacetic acid degradation protein PaaD, thioesterase n=1 Tax=Salipiger mucosus DSM 16094 TaxID=1123237 RepID=S9S9J8_9RHOB|nr:PaaI family thioesterase [Salipiger mucosus]EPX86840.1 Phenylacetic acid degradation protein PaaD, thioesterase [Salipiger mucosus DSM 16094]